MAEKVLYRGRSRTIEWAVLPDGKMPALKKWNSLGKELQAKIWAVIVRLGDKGECRNTERFKLERNQIYAIKGFKVRAYCFMTKDRRIVITNVVKKNKDKARPEDLDRAERIRAECAKG